MSIKKRIGKHLAAIKAERQQIKKIRADERVRQIQKTQRQTIHRARQKEALRGKKHRAFVQKGGLSGGLGRSLVSAAQAVAGQPKKKTNRTGRGRRRGRR